MIINETYKKTTTDIPKGIMEMSNYNNTTLFLFPLLGIDRNLANLNGFYNAYLYDNDYKFLPEIDGYLFCLHDPKEFDLSFDFALEVDKIIKYHIQYKKQIGL